MDRARRRSDMAVFAMVTTNEQAHDLGLLGDRSGISGRIHHMSFWLDQRLDVERAADILLEAHTPSNTARAGMAWASRLISISANPAACVSN